MQRVIPNAAKNLLFQDCSVPFFITVRARRKLRSKAAAIQAKKK